ncbi:hypothetical protein [Micromonospora echinospora]|uniref:hypothetical protein n=1 Tax=Micromonospora echinospora TaxID=1877 RepID=UPI003672F247
MSPDALTLLDGRAERAKRSWSEIKSVLACGRTSSGAVLAAMPFGVFVEIDGQPDALGLVEITTLPQDSELPAVGVYLNVVVADHAAYNWQVRPRPAEVEAGGRVANWVTIGVYGAGRPWTTTDTSGSVWPRSAQVDTS